LRKRNWRRWTVAGGISLGLPALVAQAATALPPAFATVRISVSSLGTQANNNSSLNMNVGGISDDGRYVAFQSVASNLVLGDTNGASDVFVHDNSTGTTTRVSVNALGVQGNGNSYWAGISADGTKVAFASEATNLVASDTNGYSDVFVKNLSTGAVTLVSVSSLGAQGNGDSAQRLLGNEIVPIRAAISGNGNRVAFPSFATNLVAGDTNGISDIFVRDIAAGTTTRVSVSSLGAEAVDTLGFIGNRHPAISDDGNVVAFTSGALNLVPGDTNAIKDVFVHVMSSGLTERVSVSNLGTQGYGELDFNTNEGASLSDDGRYVAFWSGAHGILVPDLNDNPFGNDVFVRDRTLGTTTLESVSALGVQGVGVEIGSYWPDISSDGSMIAFSSDAPNLVPGDTNNTSDVFVRVRATNKITRVSVSSSGAQSTCDVAVHLEACSIGVAMSDPQPAGSGTTPDKIFVAYTSWSADLVAGDTNGFMDVFDTKCTVCL
jgi:Tol biopolymer transport system component